MRESERAYGTRDRSRRVVAPDSVHRHGEESGGRVEFDKDFDVVIGHRTATEEVLRKRDRHTPNAIRIRAGFPARFGLAIPVRPAPVDAAVCSARPGLVRCSRPCSPSSICVLDPRLDRPSRPAPGSLGRSRSVDRVGGTRSGRDSDAQGRGTVGCADTSILPPSDSPPCHRGADVTSSTLTCWRPVRSWPGARRARRSADAAGTMFREAGAPVMRSGFNSPDRPGRRVPPRAPSTSYAPVDPP
jgi:hypothetical protein